MKAFLDERFLLHNETAEALFAHCKGLPIMDYHCHLNPAEIADNKHFRSITELWLQGDHYKWRLMRANGIDESCITGNAPDAEKFKAWCYTLEDCIGSPLYHWAHLELRRYFDYDGVVTGDKAEEIFKHCNKALDATDFSVWAILSKFNVQMLATTDDPIDDLSAHRRIRELDIPDLPSVLPTFRPSKALQIEDSDFSDYIRKLEKAANVSISHWEDLLHALALRMDYFNAMGCRASDHSLEPPVYAYAPVQEAAAAFQKALKGETLSQVEIDQYKTKLFIWLGREYAKRNWIMQMHMGAQRNNNTRMLKAIGPDTGFDIMSDAPFSQSLARLLDRLEMCNALPKAILYALNPMADDLLSTMIGNFQGHGIRGKMQWGCPWWFNDNQTGIRKHLTTLANNGILARFIGMLTDSRSFMSYPRHEYFRRVLSQVLGEWVERGEFPCDMNRLRRIAGDIAYYNAAEYFGVNVVNVRP